MGVLVANWPRKEPVKEKLGTVEVVKHQPTDFSVVRVPEELFLTLPRCPS